MYTNYRENVDKFTRHNDDNMLEEDVTQ